MTRRRIIPRHLAGANSAEASETYVTAVAGSEYTVREGTRYPVAHRVVAAAPNLFVASPASPQGDVPMGRRGAVPGSQPSAVSVTTTTAYRWCCSRCEASDTLLDQDAAAKAASEHSRADDCKP